MTGSSGSLINLKKSKLSFRRHDIKLVSYLHRCDFNGKCDVNSQNFLEIIIVTGSTEAYIIDKGEIRGLLESKLLFA